MMAVRRQRGGFVLVLAITAISLVGAAVFVLTEGAKTMLFQADLAYLESVEQNLTASGMAWARRNVRSLDKEDLGKATTLDVAVMGVRNPVLTVRIGAAADKAVEVEIATSCTKGRRTLTSRKTYRISALPPAAGE